MFPSGSEILIIILAVLVLFGGKKMPEIARWIGKGMSEFQKAAREFKQEMDLDASDEKKEKKTELKG